MVNSIKTVLIFAGFKTTKSEKKTAIEVHNEDDELFMSEDKKLNLGQSATSENVVNELMYYTLDTVCRFHDGFDFFSEINQLEELLDIRESPAYKVYSVLTDTPIKLEENIYKSRSKEDRKKLRTSASIEVGLLLRKIVEKTVEEFTNFFLKRPLLKEAEANLIKKLIPSSIGSLGEVEQTEVEPQKLNINQGSTTTIGVNTRSQVVQPKPNPPVSHLFLDKAELIKPEFMKYQDHLFPILRIDMIFDEGSLKFKETEDDIRGEITHIFDGILSAFDNLLHPEYTKIEINSSIHTHEKNSNIKKEVQKKVQIITEEIFTSNKCNEFYSAFCELVTLQEKIPKKKPQLFNFKDEEEPEIHTSKYLKILNPDEDIFEDAIMKVIDHLLNHYYEAQQSFSIFSQFKPFFIKSFDKEVQDLFDKKTFVLEEYRKYLVGLKNYESLLGQVPDKIYFPLFEVNTEKVKLLLANSIDGLRTKIFNKLEDNIIAQYKAITIKYNEIVNFVRKSTQTPEEVEAMEKFIYDLNSEKVALKNRASESFRNMMALFRMDYIDRTEVLLNLAREVYEWPSTLEKELKSAEDKHNLERAKLEEQLRDRRTTFEYRVDGFAEEIEEYTHFTEYKNYRKYIEEIDAFNEKLDQAERDMLEIQDHERKLFGIVSPFEKFIATRKQLAPYIELWKTIGEFLDAKRNWMSGPFQQINPSEAETIIKTHLKTSNKLTKMFDKNPIAARIAQEFKEDVQETQGLLPAMEILCNPGLKERHWSKIESYIGSKFNPKEGTLKEIIAKGVQEYLPQ